MGLLLVPLARRLFKNQFPQARSLRIREHILHGHLLFLSQLLDLVVQFLNLGTIFRSDLSDLFLLIIGQSKLAVVLGQCPGLQAFRRVLFRILIVTEQDSTGREYDDYHTDQCARAFHWCSSTIEKVYTSLDPLANGSNRLCS